jgi:beta-N-acetylhexosaminidase
MRALGEMWMADAMQATNAASACGYVLAVELRSCGIDLSFAPVLDLDYGASSVIGDRSFHRDARVAALLAKSVMHGMLAAGMANCGKHFPGHGFVKADSHVAIPVDNRPLKDILGDDALPYGWLSNTLASVMPAHVVYTKVDKRPAGFSPKWLNDILRGQLGFQGCVFSDDLSMEGARRIEGKAVSYSQAAVAALGAGCDMALLCNESAQSGGKAIDVVLDELLAARVAGDWQASEASENRRLALLPSMDAMSWDALMGDPRYIHALGMIP